MENPIGKINEANKKSNSTSSNDTAQIGYRTAEGKSP